MALDQLLKRANQLQENLEQLSPLAEEARQSLWEKLSLDWTWNASHMEGNSLTYEETQSLLKKRQAVEGERMQEEILGHAQAIQQVRDWAADQDWRLSEKAICELNKTVLVRPFIKEVIGPDGVKTKREIKVGAYKTFSHQKELASGALFRYAEPEEVPAKMEGLIEWYREGTADLHPVVVAATLYYVIVSIHPFEAGNGRVASLLMNYHLLKAGYSPIVLKYIDQKNYSKAIHRANEGDLNAFYEYIAVQWQQSLLLGLKAAKGEALVSDYAMDTVVNYFLPILLNETTTSLAKAQDDYKESGYAIKASIYKANKKYWVTIANLAGTSLLMEEPEQTKAVEQIAEQYQVKGKHQRAILRIEWTYYLRGYHREGQAEMPEQKEVYLVDFDQRQMAFTSAAGTHAFGYEKATEKDVMEVLGTKK